MRLLQAVQDQINLLSIKVSWKSKRDGGGGLGLMRYMASAQRNIQHYDGEHPQKLIWLCHN